VRELRLQIGPWILDVSKTRAVSTSIIIVAFLLTTVSQSLLDPAVHSSGEIDIESTSPIDQNVTYEVDKVFLPSVNSMTVLNTSETRYDGSISGYLPRFDYDRIFFNLTVSPKNTSAAVAFGLWIDYGLLTEQTALMNISQTATMSLELDVAQLAELSDKWLFAFSAYTNPAELVTANSLLVWVNSTVPLVPVSLDLETTDGSSLYDCPMFAEIQGRAPYLEISKNNNRSNSLRFWPLRKNVTFYLQPGGLNGSAGWYDWSYSEDSVQFNVTFSFDEGVALKIRLLVIRIDLHTDIDYPVTRITIREPGGSWPMYDVYVTPDIFPSFLYVPAHKVPAWDHTSQSISIMIDLEDMRYIGGYDLASSFSASGQISFNGTRNLEINVKFGQLTFYGIMNTSDLILWILSISLFLLVLVRIGIVFHIPSRRMHADSRFIPFVLFLVLAFIPWYRSNTALHLIDQQYQLTIHSLSLGALPIVGYWVEGSLIVWTIPSEALVWSILAIALYWTPLLWCLFRLDTPSDREGDVTMGILLFLPCLLAVFVSASLPDITGGTAGYLIQFLAVPLIPVFWLSLVVILTLIRRYSPEEDEATRDVYNVLERDRTKPDEIEESTELIPEKGSLWLQLFEDFATWRGWFFAFLYVLLISLPCAVGSYYSIYETGVTDYYTIQPLISLSSFYDEFSWYSIRLAALIIGLPYLLSGLFTIIALWRYSRREVSIAWVFLGAFLLYTSLLPGIMIFDHISSVRQSLSLYWWIVFEPYPVAAIIFVAISILVWLKQAYEDAEEPMNDDVKEVSADLEKDN
jgi:hypothetical protein